MKFFASMIFVCALIIPVFGQRQVVILKGQQIIWRLKAGDDFIYKLKNKKGKHESFVNNIYDYGILADRDTVRFSDIDRIYFDAPRFYNRLGGAMVVGGGALFLIDQLNVVVVHGEQPSLDAWVTKVSLTALVVGLPMMLIKKKSQRMNYKFRFLTVRTGSIFYEPD
jgi:hypothetical protein